MDEEFVIKVEHLSKAYKLYEKKSDRLREALSITGKQYHKPFYALNDIAFEVKRGETVGIIGTNGSGKSTLLKILTGVVAPSGGSFEVNGRISALLELGTGFNMEYTGLQNIDLHGTMMGFSKEEMENRREQIIQFADIGDYINQPVKNYSSGMFARLAFAVAISIEPEILIVDEALSVGDVFFQSKCFRKFDELRDNGVSILFVSHDTASVRKMCSRVLWIEKGEQRMFDTSDKVCNAYFNSQLQQLSQENEGIVEQLDTQEMPVENAEQSVEYPQITPNADSRLSDLVEIKSVAIRNSTGQLVHDVNPDEVYSVGIVTAFAQDMERVIVGFEMDNAKGIPILAANTFEKTEQVFSVNSGTVIETVFQFRMPKLHSGAYEICPAVALGVQDSHVNLTWLHGVLSINMLRSGYEIAEFGLDYESTNRELSDWKLT